MSILIIYPTLLIPHLCSSLSLPPFVLLISHPVPPNHTPSLYISLSSPFGIFCPLPHSPSPSLPPSLSHSHSITIPPSLPQCLLPSFTRSHYPFALLYGYFQHSLYIYYSLALAIPLSQPASLYLLLFVTLYLSLIHTNSLYQSLSSQYPSLSQLPHPCLRHYHLALVFLPLSPPFSLSIPTSLSLSHSFHFPLSLSLYIFPP
jgi:hypothetical protein